MITLEEAKIKILEAVRRLGDETVPIVDAHNRICARKITAPRDLPMFDTADTDGFALMTSDVLMATEDDPAELKLVATIRPGEHYTDELNQGECVQVFAGSRIPIGADAVIPLQFAIPSETKPDRVFITCSTRPWENIRKRGEDLVYGTLIANPGDRLNTAQITLLAAFGVKNVMVSRQPRICIISIGGELKKQNSEAKYGEIYESNSLMLASMINKSVTTNIERLLLPDDTDEISRKISAAFDNSDVIITTGRVSEGRLDVLTNALSKIDGLKFTSWRVTMKPGRPMVFGVHNTGKYLFGLPGNPVSAAVSYSLLVRPALLKMIGCSKLELPVEEGELVEDVQNPGNRRHFIRVKIDERKRIKLAGLQTSYGLSSLLYSNGLIDVPPHSILQKGSEVKVIKWEIAD